MTEKINEPTILDQINDEDDQRQAIIDFKSLVKHNGWRRIAQYYHDVMVYHQQQLNGDQDVEAIKSMADLKIIRFKRDMAERMVNLPDILIGLIEMDSEEIIRDPHFTPDDFNDKI